MPKILDAKEILRRNVQNLSLATEDEVKMVPSTDAPLPSVDELQHIVSYFMAFSMKGSKTQRCAPMLSVSIWRRCFLR